LLFSATGLMAGWNEVKTVPVLPHGPGEFDAYVQMSP